MGRGRPGQGLAPRGIQRRPFPTRRPAAPLQCFALPAELGSSCYLKMLLKDNFIHADLHPGNILVRLGAG